MLSHFPGASFDSHYSYERVNGTAQSHAIVLGVVAQYLQFFPFATPTDVKAAVYSIASKRVIDNGRNGTAAMVQV